MFYRWEWKSCTSTHPSATRTQWRPPESMRSTRWTQAWLPRLWPSAFGKSRDSLGSRHGAQCVAESHWSTPQDLSSHHAFFPDPFPRGTVRQRWDKENEEITSAWSPPLPSHTQQKRPSLLLPQNERAENSNFNILLKITDTAVPARFSASFPPCYNSFFNITVTDFDCQTLSCGEATWLSSCRTAAVLLQLTHAFWL